MFTLDAVQIHGGSGYVAEVELATIARALLEQTPALQAALRRAVASEVRSAVANAVARQGAPKDTGTYP
mgnify:CR=1 FL=1